MALETNTYPILPIDKSGASGTITRYNDISAINAVVTVTVPASTRTRKVKQVVVTYSATPTQAGVTVTKAHTESGAYHLVITGTANARYNFWKDADLPIIPPDINTFVVSAPAGGAGIFGAIEVIVENL